MFIDIQEKNVAKSLLQYLLKKGCKQARVTYTKSISNGFSFQKKILDKLEANNENRIYIEIFVDNKFGSFSSNRINQPELEQFASDAINGVQLLEEDIFRSLPDIDKYYQGFDDLDLYDPKLFTITTDEKFDLINSVFSEIDLQKEDLVTADVSYEDSVNGTYIVDSNGFEKDKYSTVFCLSAEVTLSTHTDARVDASEYEIHCKWDLLQKKGLLEKSYARAKERKSQQKIESGIYDLITDNRTSGKFLNPILSAINGASLDQERSFLANKKNEKIFSEKFTLIDIPHQKEKLGSRFYDSEGVATKEMAIIEHGILRNYYINTYYSRKLDLEQTTSSPSGICMTKGDKSLKELISSADRAIYVTGYNGGNSNPTTGDFSFGIDGFLVKNGKIIQAVNEMNITGNILELWNNLKEVGNDPRTNTSNQIPSLLFANTKFSGL